MAPSSSEIRPLEGVRVLELASEIAGPYAGKMLCDAGAAVIKVEAPTGDPLRRFLASGAAIAEGEDGVLFRYLNASKQSVVADLATEYGRNRVLGLAREADLLIDGLGAGGLAANGLEITRLFEANPMLSIVSVSPWGLEGPSASAPATAFTHEARSGSTLRRHLPDRAPIGSGGRFGDFAAGTYAGAGAFAALMTARRGGKGIHVDVSTFEAVITTLTTFWDLRGQWMDTPMAAAAEAPSIERASDGWVGLCTYTGQQWLDFCAMIEQPDLAKDERFLHASERTKARDKIFPAIHAWMKNRSVEDIVEIATLLRVPAAPVLSPAGVLACDHYAERGILVDNPHGFRQPRPPYRLSGGKLRSPGMAPRLGEHDDAHFETRESARATADTESKPVERPFAGLRIVDLTAFWAGPVVTSFFGDLGADVVKIESTKRPDGMRFIGASGNQPLWEWSEVFAGVNPNKRSVTLNLDTERGKELLLELVKDADVLSENASARVLENFGLDVATLHEVNPRLIVLRMPAWGLDGPWRDRPGFAATIEHASGVTWMTGYPDAPLHPNACDPLGGMHAAFGLMGALTIRERTGEGQLVESTLIEPALNIAALGVLELQAYGQEIERDGNRGAHAAPQGLYRCRDGQNDRDPEWLAIAVESDVQWAGLVRVLGLEHWADNERFTTQGDRRAHHDEIDEAISAWARDKSATEAERALVAEGVPASVARNAHSVMPDDQLASRPFFQELVHPVTGKTRYPNLPMRFSAWPEGLKQSPPPTLGQHNEEVLCGELGLSREELETLREAGVIGEMPQF